MGLKKGELRSFLSMSVGFSVKPSLSWVRVHPQGHIGECFRPQRLTWIKSKGKVVCLSVHHPHLTGTIYLNFTFTHTHIYTCSCIVFMMLYCQYGQCNWRKETWEAIVTSVFKKRCYLYTYYVKCGLVDWLMCQLFGKWLLNYFLFLPSKWPLIIGG